MEDVKGTYLDGLCVQRFGGLRGISKWVIEPFILRFYISIVAILYKTFSRFFGNAKTAVGMSMKMSHRWGAIAVRVERRH